MLDSIYEEDHRIFREGVRKFIEREVAPYHAQWERDGVVPRDVWRAAGAQGLLGMNVPEEYGGPGIEDFRFNVIVQEEIARSGASGLGFAIHTDIIVPYLIAYGTEEQKRKYLPGCVTGECILAVAMTEPNTGSDLAGIRTSAQRNGSGWLLNGQKTFISNGILADVVITVARTHPTEKHAAFTLFLIESGVPGFEPPKKLRKIGMDAQDTAELFFHDVALEDTSILGEENRGFFHLMQMLPQERLSIAAQAVGGAEAALDWTIEYCKERTAFGKPIGTFQNSRFKLAEMKTKISGARTILNNCIPDLTVGRSTTEME